MGVYRIDMKTRQDISTILTSMEQMRSRAAKLLADAQEAESKAIAAFIEIVFAEKRLRFEIGQNYRIDGYCEVMKYVGNGVHVTNPRVKFDHKTVLDGNFEGEIYLEFVEVDAIGRRKRDGRIKHVPLFNAERINIQKV